MGTVYNNLNELTGKQWLLFTKSWLVLNPQPRDKKKMHPASFPEELAASFIQFFTKENDWVLDPFLGSGTTLVAAQQLGRNGVGLELYEYFAQLADRRLKETENPYNVKNQVINADCRNINKLFKANNLPKIKFCFTSPPYWDQLQYKHRRQRTRVETGLPTIYGDKASDFGNIADYDEFVAEVSSVFDDVYKVMLDRAYLVVICNNIYKERRVWPFAFDLFKALSKKWVAKDERIWCQDNKPLYPFGIFQQWVANRCHHYCFVFKKES